MKQVAQNYRTGELALLDVPAPSSRAGGVLVRSHFSLISVGTEMMKIGESKLSMLGKARARPDQVKDVVRSVAQQGLMATYRKVNSQLDAWTPLGYSLAGEVVEVGAGAAQYSVGQRLACAGNQYALHAEFNWIPTNLCVPIPDGVASEHGAFTTVGAIAMQGYRQSEAHLGETAVVIGLGLVGQLLLQLLGAAGVNVIGIDLSPDRCRLAEGLGAVIAGPPDGQGLEAVEASLADLTEGAGADHIFLTAGGDTNQPVELAVKLVRDRGRVVDIGRTRLDLPWKDYYEKELDIRFSRSYGPGRYDRTYEEGGIDYPIGYVRWTERRNMMSFLGLVEQRRIDLQPLVAAIYPFSDAVGTYERILAGDERGVGILFEYPADAKAVSRLQVKSAGLANRVQSTSSSSPPIALGVVGAGNYATSMLLPHLARNPRVRLSEVVTTSALSAANAQRRFGFERYGTDLETMLADQEISAVLIATRHSSHADLVCRALSSGKAVFVEKPLAVNVDQLSRILAEVDRTGIDRIMVGFNRRFAPLLTALHDSWGRPGPVHVRYDINAGDLDAGSWYGEPEQGSRLVGEGCHFIDTASWWIGSHPIDVAASSTPGEPDNSVLTVRYADGSVATIAYLTGGDPHYPKETIQVFGHGQVAKLDNFRATELWRGGKRRTKRSRNIDKGQRHELDRFVDAIVDGLPMPIAFDSLVATTLATFAAEQSVSTGERTEVKLEALRRVGSESEPSQPGSEESLLGVESSPIW